MPDAESNPREREQVDQMVELDEQVARSLSQEENAVDWDEEIAFSELWPDEDLQPN